VPLSVQQDTSSKSPPSFLCRLGGTSPSKAIRVPLFILCAYMEHLCRLFIYKPNITYVLLIDDNHQAFVTIAEMIHFSLSHTNSCKYSVTQTVHGRLSKTESGNEWGQVPSESLLQHQNRRCVPLLRVCFQFSDTSLLQCFK
jgi:hypothetical protein